MKKVTKLVLMLCLILSGAFCHASGLARTENEKGNDGIPIELIKNSSHGITCFFSNLSDGLIAVH